MITLKGKSQDGKQTLYLIGITEDLIKSIRKTGGMQLTPAKHDVPEGMVINLFYANTEKELVAELKEAGLITDTTEVALTGAPKPDGAILSPDRNLITPDDSSNN